MSSSSNNSNGGNLTEPRSIVHSLTTKFHATADIAAVQRIDSAFESVKTVRAQKLAASRDNLNQWVKKVEASKWEAQRPADRSETAHADRMAQLDRDRYALAKAVNDTESTVQREEVTLEQIKNRLCQITERLRELDSSQEALSEEKIRSLVFRDMGVSWALDELADNGSHQASNKTAGTSLKCRILSRRSNDVFTLVFDPLSNSFEDAHQIWTCLGK